MDNLRFVNDDVRNIGAYGPFDAVFCSGLLYHLDRPVEYLATLFRNTRRLLILQTHYAARRRPPKWKMYPPYKFSRVVTHEGRRGRWYREYRESTSNEKVEARIWASYGNPRSFWLTKEHLLQTLRDVGFSVVYEQFDALRNVVTDPYIREHHRSTFVAIR
jgi:hypothetical protein